MTKLSLPRVPVARAIGLLALLWLAAAAYTGYLVTKTEPASDMDTAANYRGCFLLTYNSQFCLNPI